MVIGLAILIMAPVLFIKSLKRSSAINNLIQTGQKLQGVLVDTQSSNSRPMGGRSTGGNSNNVSYKIVVSATDDKGVVQNYVSDPISGIGGLAMADFRTNPITIDVYIDPANYKNYYVDVADIPNLTPQRIADLVRSATGGAQPQTASNLQQPTSAFRY